MERVNEQAGRWANNLALPADWSASGVYMVRLEGTRLIASHRLLDKEAVVPGKYNSTQSFFIGATWSETKADIHEQGGFFQQPLYMLFFCSELAEGGVPVPITGAATMRRIPAKTHDTNMNVGKLGSDSWSMQ